MNRYVLVCILGVLLESDNDAKNNPSTLSHLRLGEGELNCRLKTFWQRMYGLRLVGIKDFVYGYEILSRNRCVYGLCLTVFKVFRDV